MGGASESDRTPVTVPAETVRTEAGPPTCGILPALTAVLPAAQGARNGH